jgi:hypothetical protein
MKPTKRLYWEDDHKLTADGVILEVSERSVALDHSPVHTSDIECALHQCA